MPTFTVETGEGLADATSYVSVAEADDYLSLRPSITSWSALTSTEKETKLMWATRLIDQRATYRGVKYGTTGALRWPRSGVTDCDGVAIPYDEIPDELKAAVIELAFHFVSQSVDPSVPSASASSGGEIKRIKADVIEIEYTEGTTGTTNYFPVGINTILRCIGSLKTGSGSRFSRILRA